MRLAFIPIFFMLLSPLSAQIGIRNSNVVRRFLRDTGYPNGRKGFVVDHRIPLCAGGTDTLFNLQWEEQRESYVKDKYERALCRELKRQGYKLVKQ